VHPGVARRGGQHVVAQAVDQLTGALVLGRGLGDHVEDGGVAPGRGLGRRDDRNIRVACHVALNRGQGLFAGAVAGGGGGEDERTVEAGAEALGEPVVGDAGGRAGWVVAVVWLAEAQ
jgi:hypothetical protein